MLTRKLSSKIVNNFTKVACKFASNTTSLDPVVPKGSLGFVFAEEGKPFKVTLEEGKIYSWCPCGQSNKKPFCDGTHKVVNRTSEKKFKPVKLKVEKTGDYSLCNCRKTKNIPFCDGSHKQKNISKPLN